MITNFFLERFYDMVFEKVVEKDYDELLR